MEQLNAADTEAGQVKKVELFRVRQGEERAREELRQALTGAQFVEVQQ